MTPGAETVLLAIDRALLGCASLLVPELDRAEWLLEWQGELWHVRQSRRDSDASWWQAEREIASFCAGAFRDATCLRHLWWRDRPPRASLHGSAPRCIFWLACVLVLSHLAPFLLPGIRNAHHASSRPVRPGTILIQDQDAADGAAPTMSINRVRIWQRSRQHYADGFAFYRLTKQTVSLGHHRSRWQVAQASTNLFALTGWSLQYAIPGARLRSGLTPLVLSDRLWRQRFAADPSVVGSIVSVGPLTAQVVGIAPSEAWRLPGNTDAWLLSSEASIASSGKGYVVAHLTRYGIAQMWGGFVQISSPDSDHMFLGTSLDQAEAEPWSIYWFGVLLAILALPAVASVSLAEFSFSLPRPLGGRRAVRFGFLGLKIALFLSIAYSSSFDLAYCNSPVLSPSGTYIQLCTCFAICLFGMRWALLDQRQRCPVCLKRVTHPAEVGSLSRMFLAWSGTELICTEGHTLLHVPSLPTSWFSTQQWMYLDSSWDFLFAG